jgi:MoxR-like ATPase
MTTLPNPARTTASNRPADEVFAALAANVGLAFRGKPEVVELALMCLMAEGHLLIEDVPGVGKTSLVKAMARSIDCDFGRIQFTPDLLPTDVVGVSVWNRKDHTFEFRPGPVFANVVLADEINRASPKTQSALLEAMAESQVTVDGTTYGLPNPFMVVATQNPVEHEGTYPLPESQMDRFLIRTAVGYPSPAAEMEILDGHTGIDPVALLDPVVSAAEVRVMVAETRTVHAAPALRSYLAALATATRQHPQLTLGMSPRATLALLQASRAKALVAGRNFVTPDDVHAMAAPVLGHRLICSPAAQMSGLTGSDIVTDVLSSVPVPGGNP